MEIFLFISNTTAQRCLGGAKLKHENAKKQSTSEVVMEWNCEYKKTHSYRTLNRTEPTE